MVERNHKAGQNPPRVVAPTEEEEYCKKLNIKEGSRKLCEIQTEARRSNCKLISNTTAHRAVSFGV
jgi:hypothetical protein